MIDYNFDDTLDDAFKMIESGKMQFRITADQHLKSSFAVYGIEGTETKIKELMKGKLQEFMLARYRKIIECRH